MCFLITFILQTTVALYIPAGSLLDPSNAQGLAHLTEHCIFITKIFTYHSHMNFY